MTQMLHWTKHTATYFENVNKAIKPFPTLQVGLHTSGSIHGLWPVACLTMLADWIKRRHHQRRPSKPENVLVERQLWTPSVCLYL